MSRGTRSQLLELVGLHLNTKNMRNWCYRHPPCHLPETTSPGMRLQVGLCERQAKDQAEPGRAQDHDAGPEGGVQIVQQRRSRPHRPAPKARGRSTTSEDCAKAIEWIVFLLLRWVSECCADTRLRRASEPMWCRTRWSRCTRGCGTTARCPSLSPPSPRSGSRSRGHLRPWGKTINAP